MAVRKFKPTSPGRRFMTVSDFQEITKSEPEKTLLAPLSKRAGRNVHGRITTRHRGGGHKRRYRHRRLQAPQGRDRGPRALDRVRPQPLGPDRASALRRRREALHPGAASAARRPDGGVGRGRRHPPRERDAAALDADRHDRARRRAPPRPGSQDGALRRRVGAARGQGGRKGASAAAVRRDAARPRGLPRDRRPARERHPRDRVRRQGRAHAVEGPPARPSAAR